MLWYCQIVCFVFTGSLFGCIWIHNGHLDIYKPSEFWKQHTVSVLVVGFCGKNDSWGMYNSIGIVSDLWLKRMRFCLWIMKQNKAEFSTFVFLVIRITLFKNVENFFYCLVKVNLKYYSFILKQIYFSNFPRVTKN